MATYRSPGVFNKEEDASLFSRGVSTSVAGMVGVAVKGPIGTPVLVTSWPQYQEVFGGFHSNGYLPHAVKAFFDEGGSTLYVVRTCKYSDITDPDDFDADTADADLTEAGDTPDGSMSVAAISPGAWGNDLQVKIENVDLVDEIFDLLVLDVDDNVLERYREVSVDPNADRFVETIINPASRYIYVTGHVDAAVPEATTTTLTGGADGLAGIADADFLGDAGGRTGMRAFDTIDTIKLIAIPGVNSDAAHNAIAAYAESRGTMFAVLGANQLMTVANVLAHRGELSGPYAGLYWPWLRIMNPMTGVPMLVPPEGHILGVIARNDQTAVWAAPAGLDRGRIRTALGVEYDTTQGERDELYDKAVNVIVNFTGQGVVVWGQRVVTSKPSALDRINVRRLVNFIKEVARNTTKYLLFEPNDPRTWDAFTRYTDPFLENIKQRRGLIDYHIICDETTNTPYYIDNNTMVAKIFVKPTRTAEFIEIQYIVTGAGVDFSEL